MFYVLTLKRLGVLIFWARRQNGISRYWVQLAVRLCGLKMPRARICVHKVTNMSTEVADHNAIFAKKREQTTKTSCMPDECMLASQEAWMGRCLRNPELLDDLATKRRDEDGLLSPWHLR